MDAIWFAINILVPLALPSLGPLPILLLPAAATTYGTAILTTVKDGQLCWGVVAMGLSTTYELAEGALAGKTLRTAYVAATFMALFMALSSMGVAAAGAFFPVTIPAVPPASWVSHYKALVASLVMAVVAAGAFTYVHFVLH